MATVTLELEPKKNKTFTEADVKKSFAGKTVIVNYNERRQTDDILAGVRDLIADRELREKVLNAKAKFTGLPTDIDDLCGERHKFLVEVSGVNAGRMDLYVEAPESGGEPKDVGLAGINDSETMAKKLAKLAKEEEGLKDLKLKLGDSQHPGSLLWQFGGTSNSIPLTAHTKGDGGKNEKVALDKLKKAFKRFGYI